MDILKKTLQLLTSDPYFQRSDLVEIVISDNCSTDHTAAIAKHYIDHFPNKVTYHRTTHNLAEGNFEFVLRKGRGAFRKLQNDSFGIQNVGQNFQLYSCNSNIICNCRVIKN